MSFEDDILIDNYLRGKLNDEDRAAFEDRLKFDSDFKTNFELERALWLSQNPAGWNYITKSTKAHRDYKAALKEKEIVDLKKRLQGIDSAYNVSSKPNTYRFFYILAAASILFFLAFQLFFNNRGSNQEVYDDFISMEDLPSFVSRSDASSKLIEAQNLFENAKYEEALRLFQALEGNAKDKASIALYKGISEIELGKFDEAERTFNTLIENDLIDAQKGYWFKALLFIKSNKVEEAKMVLNKIVSNNYYKSDKAKDILEILE